MPILPSLPRSTVAAAAFLGPLLPVDVAGAAVVQEEHEQRDGRRGRRNRRLWRVLLQEPDIPRVDRWLGYRAGPRLRELNQEPPNSPSL